PARTAGSAALLPHRGWWTGLQRLRGPGDRHRPRPLVDMACWVRPDPILAAVVDCLRCVPAAVLRGDHVGQGWFRRPRRIPQPLSRLFGAAGATLPRGAVLAAAASARNAPDVGRVAAEPRVARHHVASRASP